MSDEHARDLFADLNARVADGDAAAEQRAALVHTLYTHLRWPQTRIADAAGLNQPGVSKILKKPPTAVGGDEKPQVVVGRLLGLAHHLATQLRLGRAPYEARVTKMLGGTWPITPLSLSDLLGFVRRDLDLPGVPRAYRDAFEQLESRLAGMEVPEPISTRLNSWAQVVV
ncbi:MAG TPA: hypothetical protein VLH10_12930, partial [Yinghuangia sp.]|nr:hypothetical protein [Yinghuangia sp.]